MHLLSKTLVVNGLAWTWERPMLEITQIDGCSGCPDEMIDTWVSSQHMCLSKPRW